MHADSLLTDLGGNTPTVMAFDTSLVLNRTTLRDSVHMLSGIDYQPVEAGGPDAGQHIGNGFMLARGASSALLIHVRPHSSHSHLFEPYYSVVFGHKQTKRRP